MNTYKIITSMLRNQLPEDAPEDVLAYARAFEQTMWSGKVPKDLPGYVRARFLEATTLEDLEILQDDLNNLTIAYEDEYTKAAEALVYYIRRILEGNIPYVLTEHKTIMTTTIFWDKFAMLIVPEVPKFSDSFLEQFVVWHAQHHAVLCGTQNGCTANLVDLTGQIHRLSDEAIAWLATLWPHGAFFKEAARRNLAVYLPDPVHQERWAREVQTQMDLKMIPELPEMLENAQGDAIKFLMALREWATEHLEIPGETVKRIAIKYCPTIMITDEWGIVRNVTLKKIEEVIEHL